MCVCLIKKPILSFTFYLSVLPLSSPQGHIILYNVGKVLSEVIILKNETII